MPSPLPQQARWEQAAKECRGRTATPSARCASGATATLTCKSRQAQSGANAAMLWLGSEKCHCSGGKADALRCRSLFFEWPAKLMQFGWRFKQLPVVQTFSLSWEHDLRCQSRESYWAAHAVLLQQTPAQNPPPGKKALPFQSQDCSSENDLCRTAFHCVQY